MYGAEIRAYAFLGAPDEGGQFYETVASLPGKERFVLIWWEVR
jgi:hypothetical protein